MAPLTIGGAKGEVLAEILRRTQESVQLLGDGGGIVEHSVGADAHVSVRHGIAHQASDVFRKAGAGAHHVRGEAEFKKAWRQSHFGAEFHEFEV